MKINSAQQFKDAVIINKEFQEELRKDPVKAVEKVTVVSPLDRDVWIYRIVVLALGFTILIAVIGSIYLAANKIESTPEILVAIGSTAVGALAGLLAPSPGSK
jgi:uncharacterized membrane protein YbhN (UPF0104 family)